MSTASFPESRVLKYPLHNFSFPTMSWGQHRVFRCVNSIAETGLSGAVSTDMERQKDTHCGKSSTQPAAGCSGKDAAASTAPTAATAATVPWNLRKRRAACFSPGENDRSRYPSISPSHWQFGRDSPGRVDLKSGGQRQRPKFSVSLSREEIEGDFYVFMGMKPPRRPQKRPRIVQRKLDVRSYGIWNKKIPFLSLFLCISGGNFYCIFDCLLLYFLNFSLILTGSLPWLVAGGGHIGFILSRPAR